MIIYDKSSGDGLIFTSKETCYGSYDCYWCNNLNSVYSQSSLLQRCASEYYTRTPASSDIFSMCYTWDTSDNAFGTICAKLSWMTGQLYYRDCYNDNVGNNDTCLSYYIMCPFKGLYSTAGDYCVYVKLQNDDSCITYFNECVWCDRAGAYATLSKYLSGNIANVQLKYYCCYIEDGTCQNYSTYCNPNIYLIKEGANCYICTDSQLLSDNGIICLCGQSTTSNTYPGSNQASNFGLYPSNIKVLSGGVKYPKPTAYKTE